MAEIAPSLKKPRAPFHQPAKGAGYRANVDALHLARFAATKSARAAFDLGAGAGAVGLALLEHGGAAHVTFVELDGDACAFCLKNIADREIASRARVIESDVLQAAAAHRGKSDLVVCNPPYVEPGAGRSPSEPRRARARQGSLDHFVKAARLLLARRGRACFVYPAPSLTSLLALLRGAGLEPKRMRLVHAKAKVPARIALVEAQPAKEGGLRVEPPLVET